MNMIKTFLTVVLLFTGIQSADINRESAFQDGEWFKFEVSFSGFLKAGEATLNLKNTFLNGKPVYHAVGKGWTTGAIGWFFNVEDRYESYFDRSTLSPYKFIRKIDEGGYTKDIEINFNPEEQIAIVNDKKRKSIKEVKTAPSIQDMVSAYYYLRNNFEVETIQVGQFIELNMFFDYQNYPFKMQYLGRETLKINVNGSRIKIETLKFRPHVMAGRVFKEEESLAVWVSADKNKIPLKIKANLAVGNLQANLFAFKGLKHPFEVIHD